VNADAGHVSAEEMKRVLEPISPPGGIIQADSARNTITLSGNTQDIAGMLEAVSIFDVDVMKGMSFAMVPVETSAPDVIADELREVFATENAGPMAGMVRFLPNKRLGAILVISPQRQYLSRAEGWIKRLDAQASGSEKRFYTYKVQNRQAQELVEVLRSMLTSNGASQTASRNVSPQQREATIRTASASGLDQASSNGFSNPNGSFDAPSSPEPAQSPGQGILEGADDAPFKIVADPAKNAILVESTPKDYKRIRSLIKTLDVMPNQVLIEATIAEVTLTDELRFGVRWYFKERSSTFTFSDAQNGIVDSIFPGFSYALAMTNVEATINALNDVTDVNIVSSPSLTVMDNKTAKLQIGDQVPITTQTASNADNSDVRIVNSVSYRDTGVILTITAFKRKDDQVDKTELIILIRPQVMRDLEEAQHITEEFKQQFMERVLDQKDKSRNTQKVFHRAFD
jgi:general secretion pathway protein D